jgi:ABC-type multidrug transport system ATPase subunit
LEDAEKLCKRVLIMNKGSVLLVGSPDELRQKTNEKPMVEVALKQVSAKILKALDGVTAVEGVKQQENRLLISVKDTVAATPELVRAIVAAVGDVLSVNA